MKEVLVLLLSRDGDELRLLNEALDDAGVRIVTMADVAMAVAEVGAQRADLIVVGPSMPSGEARWFVERIMASAALLEIPVVMMFYEARRSWVLEMIKLGLRAYIMLPREREDLRRRLMQHLPTAKMLVQGDAQLTKPRESVGERLRQRIARRQLEQAAAHTRPEPAAPAGESIMVLEQQYMEESGLIIRSSKREISLHEKIDDYLLRLGGSHSHLVGIFVNLLVVGKVRVAFRNKTERLSLVDNSALKSNEDAIHLIDEYLRHAAAANQPDTKTQRIIMANY
jgi:DNA-binding response OmpR family regulator